MEVVRYGRRWAGSAVVCLGPVALVLVAVVLALAGSASARTVWLCRPGVAPDPCDPGLSTTVYSARLSVLRVIHPHAVKQPKIDCFYVYPTVSDQPGPFANLRIGPEERSIALQQAARYSQYCNVYAPMYRQGTLPALTSEPLATAIKQQLGRPLTDVENAFEDYLRHDNHGRGFVLIGHSQGSILLRRVIATRVDTDPQVRRRLLSAILLGANVMVKGDSGVGGDFQHIPACRRAGELHCVIAFSTFDSPPPASTLFGVSTTPGQSVLCTNPAALTGPRDLADPIFPSRPFAPGTLISVGISLLRFVEPRPPTVWSSEPGAYTVRCTSGSGPHVLEVSPNDGAQVPMASPSPSWGLHLLDANLTLGDLIAVVHRESIAYAKAQAGR